MRVVVINLDRSPERLVQIHNELTRWGLTYERSPAIDGATLPSMTLGGRRFVSHEGQMYKAQGRLHRDKSYLGAAGCYFSHLRLLERLIEEDNWPVLVLEDDVRITALPVLPDTSKPVVYFGGSWHRKQWYGSFAICYKNKEAVQRIVAAAKERPDPIDCILVRLIPEGLYHYELPYIVKHENDFPSTIQ